MPIDRVAISDQIFFGTLLVPSLAHDLERDLHELNGWRVATFTPSGAGYQVAFAGWVGYVDFATAPFPSLDVAAILFDEETSMQARVLADAYGIRVDVRQVETSLGAADRIWLNDLAVRRFSDMLEELAVSQAAAAAMRRQIDEMRTGFSMLETYLHRHDVAPLRRIWHAPYRECTDLDLTIPFAAALPLSSWGLTRLELWIVGASPISSLVVELIADDTHEVIASWSLSPSQVDFRSGWISFDLERSLATYGQPLRFAVSGEGWRLGGSAPWIIAHSSNGDIVTTTGPAMRVYATLPGISGPQGIAVPTDDRRRLRILSKEFTTARALSVPSDIDFSPVSPTDNGLLVHPVENALMVAVLDNACPAQTVVARMSILHGHTEGEPFLVTLTPGTDFLADTEEPPLRADEAGVIHELGPVPAGTWVRLDAGAIAHVTFSISPLPRVRDLHIATRSAPNRPPDLAWATVTGLEFVLADG